MKNVIIEMTCGIMGNDGFREFMSDYLKFIKSHLEIEHEVISNETSTTNMLVKLTGPEDIVDTIAEQIKTCNLPIEFTYNY